VGNISISHIGFLTPGNYPDGDPLSGLEQTLQQLQFGEELGFDSAWVRQRHLEPGISSASAFLAAATQRTSRIELGTAVIPIGYESPYRLAEDLATVDILARGRLNIGVSAGRPLHAELIARSSSTAIGPATMSPMIACCALPTICAAPIWATSRRSSRRPSARSGRACSPMPRVPDRPHLVWRRLAALGRMGRPQWLQSVDRQCDKGGGDG